MMTMINKIMITCLVTGILCGQSVGLTESSDFVSPSTKMFSLSRMCKGAIMLSAVLLSGSQACSIGKRQTEWTMSEPTWDVQAMEQCTDIYRTAGVASWNRLGDWRAFEDCINEKKVILWQSAAEIPARSSIAAKYHLANAYFSGVNSYLKRSRVFLRGDRTNDQYLQWLKEAAEGGHDEAQNFLGHLFRTGTLLPKNEEKGFELLTKSADQGNKSSIYFLIHACYLHETSCVHHDDIIRWMTWLSYGDKGSAFYRLGRLCEKNKLGDNDEARRWYTLAAQAGLVSAQNKINKFKTSDSVVESTDVQWCIDDTD